MKIIGYFEIDRGLKYLVIFIIIGRFCVSWQFLGLECEIMFLENCIIYVVLDKYEGFFWCYFVFLLDVVDKF